MLFSTRRTWLAAVVGIVILLGLWLASVFAEPYLIALVVGSVATEPRSSASGWANSNVWVASVVVCCLVLLNGGYLAKRMSPPRSSFVPIILLAAVLAYAFFAQFPATRSSFRIALWSIGLPFSFGFGAWLGSRAKNAA